MNQADIVFLNWLTLQINSGKRTITVPASLLEGTSEDGRLEASRLARIAGCILDLRF